MLPAFFSAHARARPKSVLPSPSQTPHSMPESRVAIDALCPPQRGHQTLRSVTDSSFIAGPPAIAAVRAKHVPLAPRRVGIGYVDNRVGVGMQDQQAGGRRSKGNLLGAD